MMTFHFSASAFALTVQFRQQLCEHPFGTIKRQRGYDHILLIGLKKNNGEIEMIP